MALQSTGCGLLVSTEKSQPGLGKNGGGAGRENPFGGLGLVVPGGAGLLVFISTSPVGQDHCGSFLLHLYHGPYPIPSSRLCPSLPAHLPPTSHLPPLCCVHHGRLLCHLPFWATLQLSLPGVPTSILAQHPLAGYSFLEEQKDWLPMPYIPPGTCHENTFQHFPVLRTSQGFEEPCASIPVQDSIPFQV